MNKFFKVFLLAFALLTTTVFNSQAGAENRQHTVSLELLGRAGLYSFNYDYSFNPNVSAGAGFSFYSISSGGDSATLIILPVYVNYYFMEHVHRPFVSGGIDLLFASAKVGGSGTFTGSGAAAIIGGGYEYKGDSGFVFRAAPYFLIASNSGLWLGLSAGYSFE